MTAPRLAVLVSAFALAACGTSDTPMSAGSRLSFGDWGGDHADVNASAAFTYVLINCSTGAFAGNIALDASGRFAVNGSWNRSVGPVQVNGNMPAQFSGQVVGNTLTFAIAVNDTIAKQVSSLGPMTVVFGKQATGQVCPL